MNTKGSGNFDRSFPWLISQGNCLSSKLFSVSFNLFLSHKVTSFYKVNLTIESVYFSWVGSTISIRLSRYVKSQAIFIKFFN